MILGAETIFPPSFYFFPYLLVYPFSQEFDAISPQLPWTVCTFDKGTESSNSMYTYIVSSLCEYIYPFFLKEEQVYVYMYIYIYFDSYTRGRHVWKIQCLVLFSPWKALCLPRSTIFIFNPWEYLLEFRIFLSFFFSFCTCQSNAFKKK